MAINKIQTGQTFGNWLDTTNQMIDDLNAATPNRIGGRLARYSSTGNLDVFDLDANTLILSSGTRIDRINTDYRTFEDDNTILTANAVYQAIRAEDKSTIKDTPGGLPANSSISVALNEMEFIIDGALQMSVFASNTTFENDLYVKGDLFVQGNTVEFTTETLNVEDNNIILNKNGTVNKSTAEGAGFDVDKTSAFFRLVNSENRFPLYNDVKNIELDTANPDKSLYSINNITNLPITINEKDILELRYTIDPVNEPKSNKYPIGIGLTEDVNREQVGNVIEPAVNGLNQQIGEVEYIIGGTSYSDYNSYKAAFLATNVETDVVVKFTPENEGIYYYWGGRVVNTSEFRELLLNVGVTHNGLDGVYVMDEPDDNILDNNPSINMFQGDTYKFGITLSDPGQRDHYFAIGKTPYTDPNRTDVDNIITDKRVITYEVDGNVFDFTAGDTFDDYIAAFTNNSSQVANITFTPIETAVYNYWSNANNQIINAGAEINVSANNIYMGAPINVQFPMGLQHSRTVSIGTINGITGINLNGNPKEDLMIDAGDTITFTVPAALITSNPLDVIGIGESVNADPLEFLEGVDYIVDDVLIKTYAGYVGAYTTNHGKDITIKFTPITAGDYYYWSAGNQDYGGKITVNAPRVKSLSAFHLNTDNDTATIENPSKFRVTKNHVNVFELNGEFADFSGTNKGLVLPSESFDFTAAEGAVDGIIRYNPLLKLFEGYSQNEWRGLGGVIDLNQDTFIEAGTIATPADDTLYFSANGKTVSIINEEQNFLESDKATVTTLGNVTSDKEAKIRVESNANTAEYSIIVDGKSDISEGGVHTVEDRVSGIRIDHVGMDIDSNGYLKLPVGEVSERPLVAREGMIRLAADSLQVWDVESGNYESIGALEYYEDTSWKTLTFVTNEFTSYNRPSATNVIEFTDIQVPFEKNDVDVYVDGLRVQKSDFDIVTTSDNQIATTVTVVGNDYNYTTAVPATVGYNDVVAFTIPIDSTSNTSPFLIGIDVGGGNIQPASIAYGVTYGIYDGANLVDYTGDIANYISTFEDANTHGNNAVVTLTTKSNQVYHLYSNNASITTTTLGASGHTLHTCSLNFVDNRASTQVISVVHRPGRTIGTTTIDAVNKSELSNGYVNDIRITGTTHLGAGQKSISTTSGALIVSGGVGVGGDLFVEKSITELSAAELKENISPIDSALDKIKQLVGVEFTWKDDKTESKEYGLIAENVAEITPNLASFKDAKPQGVKYSKVVALLIEAMKQQQEEIDILKSLIPKKRTRKNKSE